MRLPCSSALEPSSVAIPVLTAKIAASPADVKHLHILSSVHMNE